MKWLVINLGNELQKLSSKSDILKLAELET